MISLRTPTWERLSPFPFSAGVVLHSHQHVVQPKWAVTPSQGTSQWLGGVGGCRQAGAGQPGDAASQMFPFLPLWLHVNDSDSYTDIRLEHLSEGKEWLQFGSRRPVVMKREKLKYLAPGKDARSTAILDQRPCLCPAAVAVARCKHREPPALATRRCKGSRWWPSWESLWGISGAPRSLAPSQEYTHHTEVLTQPHWPQSHSLTLEQRHSQPFIWRRGGQGDPQLQAPEPRCLLVMILHPLPCAPPGPGFCQGQVIKLPLRKLVLSSGHN